MRVAIARDYFPAYARLPRKAQRKADELLRKLEADPKQASIHYEPIVGAHDAQLRSVRVGDDYRAVLRAPERGDIFLLLWVDHHDEAYRWARSKRTEVHPSTGTLQLFDVERATHALKSFPAAPEPAAFTEQGAEQRTIAGLFGSFSDDTLFQGGVPRVLLPAVRAVCSEEDLDQLLPHLPTEAGEVLTGLAAGFALDVILDEVLGHSTAATPPTLDVSEALQRPSTQQQFRVVDEDFDLDAALANPLDVWRVYLHPRQKAIATARTKGPMRVTGGAGTGKTVVALHRAAFLAREVFTKPDDRVLFTTFTVNLAHDIRRQLEKLLSPNDLVRVEVRNIDVWASDYLKSVGEPARFAASDAQEQAWTRALDVYAVPGFTAEFCRTEWRDVVQALDLTDEEAYVRATRLHRGLALGRRDRRLLWPLFRAYRQELSALGVVEPVEILRRARKRLEADAGPRRYRAVVVDETQDFSQEALRLVRTIAGPEHPDDLFLVGDANQRIYSRPITLSSAGIQVRGRRSQHLRLNYRTTAAICRWALGALGPNDADDLDDGVATRRGYVSLREGKPPSLRHFEHAADEVHFVVSEVKRLLSEGTPPEGICITARTAAPLRDRFHDGLLSEGIAADLLEREEPRHASVRLATMHRVKGLEFPVVFVVGVNDGDVPYSSAELSSADPVVARQTDVAERCLLYVAASRARDALHVSSWGTPSPYLADLGAPPKARPLAAEEAALTPPRDSAVEDEPEPSSPREGTDLSDEHGEPGNPPLDSLSLPTRMMHWAEKRELTTLRELAAVDPVTLLSERNLGRKTVSETRAIIEQQLGRTWEELAVKDAGFGSAGEQVPARPPASWDELRAALPSSLRDVPLDEVELPVRMRNFVEQEGLRTVAQLARWSAARLVASKNLGRSSVTQTFQALCEHEGRAAAARAVAGESFMAALKVALQEQDALPRMILTQRAGLSGHAETLQSIGEMMGVSRERIRQVENGVLADLSRQRELLRETHRRLDTLLVDGAVALEQLSDDAWWSAIANKPESLDYFGERLLGGAVRVVEVDERNYAARCPQATFDDRWVGIKKAASELSLPAPLARLQELLEPVRSELGAVLADLLWNRLQGIVHIEEEGPEGARVVAFGTTNMATALALLRASPTPLRVEEIAAHAGRGRLPEEALFLGHGLVGLEQHFPDFDAWMKRLVPASIKVMEQEAPERQWLPSELLEDLREEQDIPAWLTHWHLGSLLRRSGRVRYLGRQRVALLEGPEDSGRIHFRDELVRILRERGSPMLRDDLVEELRKKTSAAELTLVQCLSRPPFLRCDDNLMGLLDRDLPGGTEAIADAVEHTASLLEHRARGFGAAQLGNEIARLSAAHAQWTKEMCLSVLRSDSRFRFSTSGAVGLSDWDTVRVPTRLDLVKQCVDEAGGKVTVEAIQDRIEGYYGAPPPRIQIGLLANRFGATLRGEWVVMGED